MNYGRYVTRPPGSKERGKRGNRRKRESRVVFGSVDIISFRGYNRSKFDADREDNYFPPDGSRDSGDAWGSQEVKVADEERTRGDGEHGWVHRFVFHVVDVDGCALLRRV